MTGSIDFELSFKRWMVGNTFENWETGPLYYLYPIHAVILPYNCLKGYCRPLLVYDDAGLSFGGGAGINARPRALPELKGVKNLINETRLGLSHERLDEWLDVRSLSITLVGIEYRPINDSGSP